MYGGGGNEVAISVCPCHGSGGAGTLTRAEIHRLYAKTTMARPMMPAPMLEIRLRVVNPAPAG